jgi:hypothetical protein
VATKERPQINRALASCQPPRAPLKASCRQRHQLKVKTPGGTGEGENRRTWSIERYMIRIYLLSTPHHHHPLVPLGQMTSPRSYMRRLGQSSDISCQEYLSAARALIPWPNHSTIELVPTRSLELCTWRWPHESLRIHRYPFTCHHVRTSWCLESAATKSAAGPHPQVVGGSQATRALVR